MLYIKQLTSGLATLVLFSIACAIVTFAFYPAATYQSYPLSSIPALIAVPVIGFACDLASKIEEKLLGKKPETGYLFFKN